ncbi:MAG: CHAP domain-containing protein [Cryomorphaceae bacterium]|nr:CHAP domain-containing protein [Cryomorphaceae bacterium]
MSDFASASSDSLIVVSDSLAQPELHWCDSMRIDLLVTAESFLGTPYRYGGQSHEGIDCSGFVCTAYRAIGVELPRSSVDMLGHGREILLEEAMPGDILFFSNTNRRRKGVGHVGIVTKVENGDVTFIHASSSNGVRYDSMEMDYYKRHFYKVERLPLFDDFTFLQD